MSQEKIFTSGLFVNPPHDGAPDFVLSGIAITQGFLDWAKDHPQYFNEKGYLKVDLLQSKEGKGYAVVNTYGLNIDTPKKEEPAPLHVDPDLPF